jgi:hypothetical protein
MGLTAHETWQVAVAGLVSSTMSLVGSLTIILLFCFIPNLRSNLRNRFVFYLSVSNIVSSGTLISDLLDKIVLEISCGR